MIIASLYKIFLFKVVWEYSHLSKVSFGTIFNSETSADLNCKILRVKRIGNVIFLCYQQYYASQKVCYNLDYVSRSILLIIGIIF